jgi:hypothetical protein
MEIVHDRCSTLLTEFGTALTSKNHSETISEKLAKLLLAYRSTPHQKQNETPSMLFMGREQGNTIRIITKLPNSEQSSKGKVKPHKYINRHNQSSTGKL